MTPDTTERGRDDRLNDVLLAYLEACEACEAGGEPDRAGLLAAHPDLRDDLAAFFAGRDEIERLAGVVREGGRSRSAAGALDSELGQLGDFRLVREVGRADWGGVRGRATLAPPPGGAQGAALRLGPRLAATPAVQERGRGRRAPAAREHRPRLRGRLRTGRPLLRDAVRRGAEPRRTRLGTATTGRGTTGGAVREYDPGRPPLDRVAARGAGALRLGGRAGATGGAGPRTRPPTGRRPPGREAR